VLVGVLAYGLLPVSPLPQVDFPTIRVNASLPGASPDTMAASVAAPLERALGGIAGVSGIYSDSRQGSTSVTLEFALGRDIDGAARDVQAAIDAARGQLPSGMPGNPSFRKANPSQAPIMVLALSSPNLAPGTLYDLAATVLAQKIAQINGVGEVSVGGSSLPAIRVQLNPHALSHYGVALDEVRRAISATNSVRPRGSIEGGDRLWEVQLSGQLRHAAEYQSLVIRYRDGAPVRLGDVATITDSVEDRYSSGFHNARPAVALLISRQPGANIIATIDAINAQLPALRALVPADAGLDVVMDRSPGIRGTLHESQKTLAIAAGLVMLVVFLFSGSARAALIPCLAIPVSLIGTLAVMYLYGFSLNNLSLMALIVAAGLVVDDAIVVLENISRHIERGLSPFRAALKGSSEVGFTLLAMNLSLVAVFVSILFMGGLVEKLSASSRSRWRRGDDDFAAGLAHAHAEPVCATLGAARRTAGREVPRAHGAGLRSVEVGLRAHARMGAGARDAHADHTARHHRAQRLALHLDSERFPAVAGHGDAAGLCARRRCVFVPSNAAQGGNLPPAHSNRSRGVRCDRLVRWRDRLGQRPAHDPAEAARRAQSFRQRRSRPPAGDGAGGGGRADVSFRRAGHRFAAHVGFHLLQPQPHGGGFAAAAGVDAEDRGGPARVAGIDRHRRALEGGTQLVMLNIDREAARRLGVDMQMVTSVLNSSFSQRQIATLYDRLNQYRVIMELAPQYTADPAVLNQVKVIGANGEQVPLSAFTRYDYSLVDDRVRHRSRFAAENIGFALAPDVSLGEALAAIDRAMGKILLPTEIQTELSGAAQGFARRSLQAQPLLILRRARRRVSCARYPLRRVSMPSRSRFSQRCPRLALGALLALRLTGTEFSLIALLGLFLLIGIVMKNAILMIDFAIDTERRNELTPRAAIFEAAQMRLRPILMTNFAALLGALPLVLASGEGVELRRPSVSRSWAGWP